MPVTMPLLSPASHLPDRDALENRAKQLRVAVVSDALPERNGVGTYYQDLVTQLAERLQQITLIAPQGGPKADHEWFSLPMPGDPTQRVAFPRPAVLHRIVRSLQPHVIIVPTIGPYAYFALRLARRLRLATCVAHHTNLEKLVGLYWNPVTAAVCRLGLDTLQGMLLRRADTVVTMNQSSRGDALRRGASRVHQVGTPVATPFMRQPRSPLQTPPRRVVFLGRLAAEKGVESVLDAARGLPDYHFCVGGDGPLRGRVIHEARRLTNLQYRGWLTRDQVLSLLDESDVLVLPSSFETFGTVALEALARHRMVLVTKGCGVAQWPPLARGLFIMQDGEDLSRALRRLATLSDQQRRCVASLGWHAVEQFNDETLLTWLHVLDELGNQRMTNRLTIRAVA